VRRSVLGVRGALEPDALLAVHYRQGLEFSDASLAAARAALERLDSLVAALDAYRADGAGDAGLAGALAATRLLGTLLFGVSPSDPITLAAVCGMLLGVVMLAAYLPARRATRVDPMVALRSE